MSGPLSGIVVIELARALAGPQAGMMLGDLGARVIKVEAPRTGDDTRAWGPPFVGPEGERESTYFLSCNRNKESIALDLKSADGRETLSGLIKHADVLIENFRPAVLDRLGFGTEARQALNPRLVTLSITGFGHDGPDRGRPGYDQIAQGEAGLMSVTGQGPGDPTRVGVPIGDLLAGMNGAFGVLAALRERDRAGHGTVVRTSLLASVVGAHAFHGTAYTVAGVVPAPSGNHHPTLAPYGLFHCRDGAVQIAVGSEGLWHRFAPLVGLAPYDTRFSSNEARLARREELHKTIDDTFGGYDRASALALLADAGVPAGEVRSMDQVYEWDQTRSQGLVIEVDHATLGPISLPGPPLRFDDAEPLAHRAPPVLGQHDESIRRWLAAGERVAS
ncbi:CoA transferase [Streptomyces sp. NBC_01239]|uniref:CaiB/BaiF CoA transferase family protein n=1 Tax=Streptomyces sp. NBC_01239 TaxID=2903792 RepID=UPI0022502E49|nr:CoA transferase [Streptomyces sp. NBC_01239]MCX4817987.1 CoA transferase [Streptomyces sp. NBC_01239]